MFRYRPRVWSEATSTVDPGRPAKHSGRPAGVRCGSAHRRAVRGGPGRFVFVTGRRWHGEKWREEPLQFRSTGRSDGASARYLQATASAATQAARFRVVFGEGEAPVDRVDGRTYKFKTSHYKNAPQPRRSSRPRSRPAHGGGPRGSARHAAGRAGRAGEEPRARRLDPSASRRSSISTCTAIYCINLHR